MRCLNLIEAPDPTAEVAVVLSRIKRLLISTDNNPEDVLIVLRNWERYYAQFINLWAQIWFAISTALWTTSSRKSGYNSS